jgi:alkylhydroperoxidase family enzyme
MAAVSASPDIRLSGGSRQGNSRLRNLGHVPNERLEAIARFAKAVIATRGAVGDVELETLEAAGFTEEAKALEVVTRCQPRSTRWQRGLCQCWS